MNSYLFTITFLALMGFLTSSEVARFSQTCFERNCYLSSRAVLTATEQVREWNHLEQLRGEENPEPIQSTRPLNPPRKRPYARIAPLRVHTARPPDNSRLNIYNLLHEPRPSGDFSLYETLAQLMRTLYQEELFFQNTPQIEYRILDQILNNQAQVSTFTTPDELSTLCFEDEKLQEALYHMLQGTKRAPSLLNFLTLDPIHSSNAQTRKINFLFASETLLHAIFPHGETANRLLAARQTIWDEILDQEKNRLQREKRECKTRTDFKNDLKMLLECVLTAEGRDFKFYKTHIFDYGLGEPGNVIFIPAPLTGHLIRERYIPQQKTH